MASVFRRYCQAMGTSGSSARDWPQLPRMQLYVCLCKGAGNAGIALALRHQCVHVNCRRRKHFMHDAQECKRRLPFQCSVLTPAHRSCRRRDDRELIVSGAGFRRRPRRGGGCPTNVFAQLGPSRPGWRHCGGGSISSFLCGMVAGHDAYRSLAHTHTWVSRRAGQAARKRDVTTTDWQQFDAQQKFAIFARSLREQRRKPRNLCVSMGRW